MNAASDEMRRLLTGTSVTHPLDTTGGLWQRYHVPRSATKVFLGSVVAAAGVAGLGAGQDVLGHGGEGAPVMVISSPAAGEIVDAVNGVAALRWMDIDPDDNANIAWNYAPDVSALENMLSIVTGLKEDCDPSDAGSVFTGLWDGGPGGGEPPTCMPASQCSEEQDCYAWDVGEVPEGNYFVVGVIDDHWPDGGGGNVRFALSAGIVRVSLPDANVPPAIVLTEPNGVADLVDTCFRARWNDDDPDDDARISLFLKRRFGEGEEMPVVSNLSEDDMADGYDVDMTAVENLVSYEIVAEIDDGHHPPWRVASPGSVTRYSDRPLDGGCLPRVVDGGTGDASGVDGGVGDASGVDAAAGDAAGGDNTDAATVTVDSGPLSDSGHADDSGVPTVTDGGVTPAPQRCGCVSASSSWSSFNALLALWVCVRRKRRRA
jgi:hypothetical protein